MPNVSSASSYWNQDFSFVQAKNGTIPAATPMMTAPVGSTYPHAGVITTSPPSAPEQNPITLGLPRNAYSSIAQVNDATAVASVVVMNALAAIPSGASALPALKPYQPTQSKPVPTMQSTILCGAMISLRNPSRCPRRMQSTNADQPDVMWTTVPPAKSMAVIFAAGFETPFIQPSTPQTMCAIGKYTANIQTPTNTITAANFIRSATAPMIKAGVIMANISWYIAKTLCET